MRRLVIGDALGMAFKAHFEGEEALEIIEREDGFIHAAPTLARYFAPFDEWREHERGAIGLAKGRVLDIGCGVGRHTLHLQSKGLTVTSVNSSPGAIAVCRQRGVKDARILSITGLSRKTGIFDTIILLGNNFGLFANTMRARWLLKRFFGMTSSDACIIAESRSTEGADDQHLLEYQEWNRRRGRMPGQMRFRVRHLRYATPWFDYLCVSQQELQTILTGTRWKIVTLMESDGPHYVAVLGKTK